MNKETSKSVERINQLEEALRNIANGDMRNSRAKAKMALEGTFPPADEKPEQEAKSNGDVYAVHDARCKTVAHFAVDEKGKHPTIVKPIEPTPWSDKSAAYWHDQYQLMRERYHKQIGENSKQAERIRELEEQVQGSRDQLRDYLLNTDIHPVDSIFWQRMSQLRLALEKIKLWAGGSITTALWETAESEMRTVLCLMHTIAREAENALKEEGK